MEHQEASVDLDDELVVVRIEEAIGRLDGIEAVRLVPGVRRPVDELHIIVTPERDPKQTVRDVHSLLRAGFDLEIDHRVISVVQLADDTGKRLRDGIPRLILDSVQIELRGTETSVTVVLESAGNTFRGCAGPISEQEATLATAEATLDALAALLAQVRLRLTGTEIVSVGAERIAVAAVAATHGRTSELLTGSAVVRSHAPDAVARAVLDATNRLHRS